MSRLQRHLLFWSGYVLFKTYLNLSDTPDASWSTYTTILLAQLSFLVVKVPVVYCCFVVIDRYLEMKWHLLMAVVVLVIAIGAGSVGLSLVNHYVVYPVILHAPNVASVFAIGSILYHSFTIVFVVGLAVSIRLFRRQTQSKVREAVLEKEKTETELKYLKAQINPHFLFNTLNNIYSLSLKNSPRTAEAVMRLSKMMRFILYESGNSHISIKDELALIDDYINLEMLRYSEKLKVNFSKDVDDHNQQIAPLLLMHFVENAFKHGVSESREASFVKVEILLKDRVLKTTVVNSRVINDGVQKVHIGMENTRRQLNILYPDHRLNVSETDETYAVELIIPFSKN